MPLEIQVLGSLDVRRDGEAVAIGGPKPRQILAMLLAARGRVVSTDRMIDELWADAGPADPGAVLQSYVSRLRKLLEPEARIVTRSFGYALEIEDTLVDAWRFESMIDAARSATHPADVIESYRWALGCWTGTPFVEFSEHDWTRADIVRLEEMHTMAREELLSARLALGEDRGIVADLEALVTDHPLRERPWHQLALALNRSGRPGDALRRIAAFRSILRDELGLDPPPEIRQLEVQILESDPGLLDKAAPVPSQRARRLPAEATSLIGRSADLAGIGQLLGEHRLVTLIGPGGVGKTRLAMRVAADLWDERRGEVYVVELAPVHDPASTVAAIATALDVQPRQNLSLEETLVEFVQGRRALLVVDNCEHLGISVARLVDRMLAACADLTVLATSREVLGLPAEVVQRVTPLPVEASQTDAGLAPTVSELAKVPAVRMFVERAAASQPGFSLTAANADAVCEIVRRVDGLPLAIELAAARAGAIPPHAIVERLRVRFDLLDHAQSGRSPRHQSLTDLVSWSYQLLNDSEKILFARVSVFAGSFGLDAVEAVCTDESLDNRSVARVLADLVDKSMVQLTDSDVGRYRVLEPMRAFGREQMNPSERAQVTERHATWFLDLATLCSRSLAGPGEAAAAARLNGEFDNLRAAFSCLAERHDVERCAGLIAALREYSFRLMRAEVVGWAEDLIAISGFTESAKAPLVLAVAAYGRFVRGDLDRSIDYAEQSIALSERTGVGSSGLAERALGNAWFYRGEVDTAQYWIDRMLDDARDGSPARRAHGLYMRSVAFSSVGDASHGSELAAEALAVARTSGSPTALAEALYATGLSLVRSDPVSAQHHLQRSADVAERAGNRWIQAFALTEVLWLRASDGDVLPALVGFSHVIDMWFRGGDWANQWLSLRHVFSILVVLQDDRAAATLYGALAAIGAAYALPFEASQAEHVEGRVGQLRDRMSATDFAGAVRRGASMTDSEVIEFVQERIRSLNA